MNVALVAHDNKKKLMENLCIAYRHILCKNNLFATYHTGPILPLNPQLADYLIRLVDSEYVGVELEYETKAYESRIKELLK